MNRDESVRVPLLRDSTGGRRSHRKCEFCDSWEWEEHVGHRGNKWEQSKHSVSWRLTVGYNMVCVQ